jgi:hypothetical protein
MQKLLASGGPAGALSIEVSELGDVGQRGSESRDQERRQAPQQHLVVVGIARRKRGDQLQRVSPGQSV